MGDWYDRYDWDFYSENRPRKVVDGIKTKKEHGAIGETWWSKRWLHTLESFGMGSRLSRGRSYARQGQVVSIDIKPGVVKAKVQGSMREPYKITIHLLPLSNDDWEKVTTALASQAIFAAKLLAGEMPANIEEAFSSVRISLFPVSEEDLRTRCTCPDWVNLCKHTAAVYYILAEQFDEDPFLLFTLRGRTKEELIATLRKKRIEVTQAPDPSTPTGISLQPLQADRKLENPSGEALIRLEDAIDTFWQAGGELDTFTINPHAPSIDKAILKRLGPSPLKVGQQNVSDILSHAYDIVRSSTEQKDKEE
ncbi:MAG: SWIM zinc finger family protein [Ktedonobacteraceae bacterium]